MKSFLGIMATRQFRIRCDSFFFTSVTRNDYHISLLNLGNGVVLNWQCANERRHRILNFKFIYFHSCPDPLVHQG